MAIEAVYEVVRGEVRRLYALQCDAVSVPDRAFEPVEITGGGPPEYAVMLARGTCSSKDGVNLTQWLGTGGAVVQFWYATGGPPRMLLERQMHGFSPGPRSLLTLEHGAACPGGAGPGMCLVSYEWNELAIDLDVTHRQFLDGVKLPFPPRMNFDYETISR